ncbi:MAG: NTP transferase domain-containing protein [Nitrospirota bacterium]
MSAISEAVILIAGQGSRLRGTDKNCLKPFVPVLGRPLLSYTLEAVGSAGISTAYLVVGYESERVIAKAKQLIPPHINASFILNSDWQKQNGISLLAAAGHVSAPFLLTMGDHVFDDTVVDCLLDNFDPDLLNIAIDRKLDSIVDLDDAMKVQTTGDTVTAIGKNLRSYDAIDTGLFVCPAEIFAYLEQAKAINGGNDCSLANGIELMAVDGKVRGIDIGSARWHDIDTPRVLEHAEQDTSWRVVRSLN